RLIQEARKSSGFEVSDRIRLRWAATGDLAEALREHSDLISREVLSVDTAEAGDLSDSAGDVATFSDDIGLSFTVVRAVD
ncbi:MAG TPA: DUF5915 domain-containing protein, partial [Marmoricola sp.]|nr:DUF5915 domain-containing protein [Marmoricola sp.]